jgi:hypothetical protein
VGVADGAVFAGDLGAAFRRSYTVMGDPVNLAARLAGAAGPGELLVSPSVAAHLGDRFELTARDPVSLKGKAEPVSPSVVGAPLERHTPEAVGTPFVGRRAELEEIAAIARRQVDEVRMVVELVGPAGIGKSRLVGALPEALPEMAHLTVQAQEYDRSTAYRLVGTLLRRSVGIPLDATAEEAGRRLAEVVTGTRSDPRALASTHRGGVRGEGRAHTRGRRSRPTVSDRHHRPPAGRAGPGDARPARRDRGGGPRVDGSGIERVDRDDDRPCRRTSLAVDHDGRGGVAWPGAHRLSLGPLEPAEIETLITSVAPTTPPRLLATLVERADGNPLFAVELASLGQAETIPDTIERLIATRIDRLEARERRLLRYASVLGTEFDLDLLAEALAPVAGGFDDSGTWSALAEFITVSPLGKVRFTQVSCARWPTPVCRTGDARRSTAWWPTPSNGVPGIGPDASPPCCRCTSKLPATTGRRGSTRWWRRNGPPATWATHEAVALYRRAIGAARRRLGSAVDPVAACDAALALAEAADLTGEFDVVEEALAYASGLRLDEKSRVLAVARARLFEKRGELDAAAEALDQAIEGSWTTAPTCRR